MNLICTKCGRLWVPETGKTCPKCDGALVPADSVVEQPRLVVRESKAGGKVIRTLVEE